VNFGVGGWIYLGLNSGSSQLTAISPASAILPADRRQGRTRHIYAERQQHIYGWVNEILNGKMVINGSQPQVPVLIDSGGTLGGSGTVGTIAANGVISPGSSPGMLTSSNVTFSASGNFTVELTGPNPGVGATTTECPRYEQAGQCHSHGDDADQSAAETDLRIITVRVALASLFVPWTFSWS